MSQKSNRRYAPTALLLALLLGCGKPALKEEAEAPLAIATVEVAQASAQDVEDTLTVDGSFVTAEGHSTRLAPTAPGRLLKVIVKEGDSVREGQLLAVVDSRIQADQSASAAAGAASAQIQASESKVLLAAARAEQISAVQAAQLALEAAESEARANVQQAEIELRRLKAGARPQEIAQAEQTVNQAQVTRNKAKVDLERAKRLFAEGFIAGQEVDAAQATFDLAESSLRQAQSQLDLVRSGSREEDILAAQARLQSARELGAKRVAQARAGLRQANQGRLNVTAKAQEAASTQQLAAQRAADAVAARQATQNGELRASISGIVTKRYLNPGDMADVTTPVLEIATQDASMDFVGSVTPEEATRIRVGQLVRGPDQVTGRVSALGMANSATGMVPVRAKFSGRSPGLWTGSFASVRLVLGRLRGVPVIPKSCLLTRDDQTVVFIFESGEAKLTPVVLGPAFDDKVAIRSGIRLGAQVILLGQHELADGAKVQIAKPSESVKKDEKE